MRGGNQEVETLHSHGAKREGDLYERERPFGEARCSQEPAAAGAGTYDGALRSDLARQEQQRRRLGKFAKTDDGERSAAPRSTVQELRCRRAAVETLSDGGSDTGRN